LIIQSLDILLLRILFLLVSLNFQELFAISKYRDLIAEHPLLNFGFLIFS
jgi:hypothetical protein